MYQNKDRFDVTKAEFLSAIVIATWMFAWTAPAFAIDLQELEEQGELYVVALYTGYQSEAKNLKEIGHQRAAEFAQERLAAIEAGAELFPLHPISFPTTNEEAHRVLLAAYDETFALVGSEAANIAPRQIAAVQIAYEIWLFGAGEEEPAFYLGDDTSWRSALDRFVKWSDGSFTVSKSGAY